MISFPLTAPDSEPPAAAHWQGPYVQGPYVLLWAPPGCPLLGFAQTPGFSPGAELWKPLLKRAISPLQLSPGSCLTLLYSWDLAAFPSLPRSLGSLGDVSLAAISRMYQGLISAQGYAHEFCLGESCLFIYFLVSLSSKSYFPYNPSIKGMSQLCKIEKVVRFNDFV